MIYEYRCTQCGIHRDVRRSVASRDNALACENCIGPMERVMSVPHLDTLKMGVSGHFPTALDKWERIHKDGAKTGESPNLTHI